MTGNEISKSNTWRMMEGYIVSPLASQIAPATISSYQSVVVFPGAA